MLLTVHCNRLLIGICFLISPFTVGGLELITSTAFATVSVAFFAGTYKYLKCKVVECCTPKWIAPNITGLEQRIQNTFYGQHIAAEVSLRYLVNHLRNPNPSKALVLSFHGSRGTGKSYLTDLIVEHIFKKKLASQYVHRLIASHHFPDAQKTGFYKEQLRQWIIGNVTACGRSIFIFDEAQTMPVGLIDVLKPFIDFYPHIDGVDYRASIFIFTSSTGAKTIGNVTLETWKKGLKRNEIQYKDIEPVLIKDIYNEQGGFQNSVLVEANLISAFVPFLPLELSHVKNCTMDALQNRNIDFDSKLVSRIVKDVTLIPRDVEVFVKSGCKVVNIDRFL